MPPQPSNEENLAPSDDTRPCPICAGRMEKVYEQFHQRVFVCVECHSGLTIPATAWNVARMKRSQRGA